MSAVRAGIPTALGLHPVGVAPVVTPTTGAAAVTMPTFAVRFVINASPHDIAFDTVAIEADFGPQTMDAILGRDVLKEAIFIYNGRLNIYSIAV